MTTPSSSRFLSPLVLLVALCAGLAPSAEAQLRSRPRSDLGADRAQEVLELLGPEHIVRDAWRTTSKHFFSRALLRKKGWDKSLTRALAKAKGLTDAEDVHHVINGMLGELKVSHLGLLEHDVWKRELSYEFRNKPYPKAGCELVLLEGRYFVAGVADVSPAAKAGLLDGDEVVRIDGVAPDQSKLLVDAGHDPGLPGPPSFSLRVKEGRAVQFRVRRQRGGPLLDRTMNPKPFSLIQAARSAVRIEKVEGARVGVIELPHFIHSAMYRITRDALHGKLKDADALVLDVRGRGGSSGVVRAILGLFGGRRAVWHKPVVVLTDGHTRSAKEIFAHRWRQMKLGPIVGERTQGAVIACRFFELSDGSILCLPIRDVRFLSGGVDLEGVGVQPDVRVTQHPLPYRQGKDRILTAGLRRAAGMTKASKPEAF
jgi:carboxyl-terminal processing protease